MKTLLGCSTAIALLSPVLATDARTEPRDPPAAETSRAACNTDGGAPCYANCDGSTGNPVLTPNDFVCFLSLYNNGDSRANCDGSTGIPRLTPNDFACFLSKFLAGCS